MEDFCLFVFQQNGDRKQAVPSVLSPLGQIAHRSNNKENDNHNNRVCERVRAHVCVFKQGK